MVAVCAIVFRGEEMLAMRRSASKDAGPGLWEAISGRVEPGEEPADAALREVAEESGLAVRLDPRPVTTYHARRLGMPMIVIVYRAEHVSGEVELSDEHDAFEWLTPDAFAERSSLDKLVAAVQAAAHVR